MADRMLRALSNGLKICFFATFLPSLIGHRKALMEADSKRRRQILYKILKAWLLPAVFIAFGSGLPFVLICLIPFNNLPFPSLSFFWKNMFVYGLLPMSTLAVEPQNRMPGYVGFYISKVISVLWQILKFKHLVPVIPFEKQMGMAILSALIGFLSVKQSNNKEPKETCQKTKVEVQSEGFEPRNLDTPGV